MRSTSTAGSARWQPWQVGPTRRAMATPPRWERSRSYSAHRSSGTSVAASSRAGAGIGQLRHDRPLGLGQGRLDAGRLGGQGLTLGVELGHLRLDRLGELHDLELLVFEAADAAPERGDVVLQGLQLPGVGNRARVEPLVGLADALVEGGDLVLEALLAAGQLAPPVLDDRRPGLEGGDRLSVGGQLGPLGQCLRAVRQLVDVRVVGLYGQERLPTGHRRPTLPAPRPDPTAGRQG